MKNHVILKIFIALFTIFTTLEASIKTDKIDWIKGSIVSTGASKIGFTKYGMPVNLNSNTRTSLNRSRMNSYKEAKEIAIEKISNKLRGIQVNSDKKMYQLLAESKFTQKRINFIIENDIIFKNSPSGFRKSICNAELKIGSLIKALPFFYPEKKFPIAHKIDISTEYTSLIVDARNIGVNPMILPSIYDEDGLEIYGKDFIDIKYAAKYKMVSYVYNDEEARKNLKTGNHPFFTIAIKSLNGCPVLSKHDISRIYSHKNTIKNLKICKVIFIIDRDKK